MISPDAPRKGFYPYAIAALIVLFDQACKWMVRVRFDVGDGVDLAGHLVRFTHLQNPGGAFGIFRNSGVPFTFLSWAAAVILVIVIRRLPAKARAEKLALSLILGGAAGNLIDRIRFGQVVDFIDIGWHELRWPVFNLADMAVVTGVGLFLLLSLRRGDPIDREKRAEQSRDQETLRSPGGSGPEA